MAAQTALSKDMQTARAKSKRLLAKYPGSIPVVCRKAPDADLPSMDKKQFLVPRSMLCDEFKDTVRKHIIDTVGVSIASAQAICLSACGQVLNGKSCMSDLYSQYKADDFLLHMEFGVGGQSESAEVAQQAASDATAGVESQPPLEAERKSRPNAEAPMSAEARRIFAKHPNSIPVVCERASGSNAPGLIKNRFLVPQTMLCGEFAEVVRKHVKEESTAMSETLLAQGSAAIICLRLHSGAGLDAAAPMRVLYEEHRAADGFLYLCYSMTAAGLEATAPPVTQEDFSSSVAPAESAPLSGAAPISPSDVAEPEASEPCAKLGQESPPLPQAEQQDRQGNALQAAEHCDLQEEVEQTLQDEPDEPDGTDSDCPAAKTPIETVHLPDNDPMSDVGEVEDQPVEAKNQAASPTATPIAVTNSLPTAAPGRAPSTEASGGLGAALGVPCDSSPQQAAQQTFSATAETMTHSQGEEIVPTADTSLPVPEPPPARPLSSRMLGRPACPPPGAKAWASTSICEEAARMLAKYPDRVPVICRRAPGREAPELRKTKFLVPGKMFCSEFKYLIHQQLRQSGHQGPASDRTIYLFLNDTSPKTNTLMADLYDHHKADDGYLYLTYSLENTLGSIS